MLFNDPFFPLRGFGEKISTAQGKALSDIRDSSVLISTHPNPIPHRALVKPPEGIVDMEGRKGPQAVV